jgi:membrane protein required for colicin V production
LRHEFKADQAIRMASLTGWDWFVLLVALFSIGFGLMRGFVRTVFALAGWLIALIATPIVAPMLVPYSGLQSYPWAVYLVLFVLILIGVRQAGRMIARGLRSAGLGGADRGLGALLGVARAAIIIAIAAVAAHAVGLSESASWQEAWSRPLLDRMVNLLEPYLPEQISGIRRT